MGGDVTVQSEYGKGSTFTIELSQKIASQETLAQFEPLKLSLEIVENGQEAVSRGKSREISNF